METPSVPMEGASCAVQQSKANGFLQNKFLLRRKVDVFVASPKSFSPSSRPKQRDSSAETLLLWKRLASSGLDKMTLDVVCQTFSTRHTPIIRRTLVLCSLNIFCQFALLNLCFLPVNEVLVPGGGVRDECAAGEEVAATLPRAHKSSQCRAAVSPAFTATRKTPGSCIQKRVLPVIFQLTVCGR